ncbi:uncharacterized protein LOC107365289 [Tetranychus urticae]|uniref:uncharacterized protein LOC107365289 n=1 Tax=Tetranychus urticae TaxID=32264 RepID=UPI00077BB34A|nr:uncharacterized protein LOC107365289 [Tetranychus urticae]
MPQITRLAFFALLLICLSTIQANSETRIIVDKTEENVEVENLSRDGRGVLAGSEGDALFGIVEDFYAECKLLITNFIKDFCETYKLPGDLINLIVNLIHPLGYSPEYDSEIGSYTEQHGLPKPKYSSPRPYPPPQAHHRPGHPRY